MVGRIVVAALLAFAAIAPAAQPSASAAAPPAAVAPVAVPPDLQALEQKMLALKPTSERFSATVDVAEKPTVKGPVGGFKHIFGHASAIATPLLTLAGEVSFGTPQEASIDGTFLGIPISLRLIGTTLYAREPFIAKLDGGRPWVEERNKSLAEALGSQPAGPGGSGGAPGAGFKSLTALIGRARSIVELGPATIDGQAATGFRLSIPLAALLKRGHSRQDRLRARIQHKLFAPLVRVELFLTETGLPVRTSLILYVRHGKGELIEQSDITAIDVPVLVQAPPAAETITAAELERAVRRHARRVAARRRKHGRRIVAVRRGKVH